MLPKNRAKNAGCLSGFGVPRSVLPPWQVFLSLFITEHKTVKFRPKVSSKLSGKLRKPALLKKRIVLQNKNALLLVALTIEPAIIHKKWQQHRQQHQAYLHLPSLRQLTQQLRAIEKERSAVSRADNRTGDHSQKVATTQATTSGVSSSSITSTADATIKSNRKTIKSRKSTGRKQGGKTPVVSETGSAGRFLVSLLSSTDSPIFEIADATDRSNSINASASAGDSTNLSQQTDNTLQPKDSTEVADSTLANTIPSGTDTAKVLPFINTSNHHIYMNLGVNTLFGIAELQNQFTMRESIGLGYDYTINTRYFFSLNAEYHSISKISYYRYIGENTKNISSSTYFTKTTLKYISIDPKIGVYLGKRHHVTLGAGLEFLLKDSDPGFEVKGYADEGSQTSGDYYSRFSPVNFYAGVGYGFRFSKNASLFATCHYGFSDLIRNSEANTTFDRNSRLQLLLRVKLF